LSAFSFNIEDYIEEGEVSSSAILSCQEEITLADAETIPISMKGNPHIRTIMR